jgi:hypothetical protein
MAVRWHHELGCGRAVFLRRRPPPLLSNYRARRVAAGAAHAFGFVPRYGRDISQQRSRVRDNGIAVDAARLARGPALGKGFHLAFQPDACTCGTPGFPRSHDKILKAVIATLAHIFKYRHGRLPRGNYNRNGLLARQCQVKLAVVQVQRIIELP